MHVCTIVVVVNFIILICVNGVDFLESIVKAPWWICIVGGEVQEFVEYPHRLDENWANLVDFHSTKVGHLHCGQSEASIMGKHRTFID